VGAQEDDGPLETRIADAGHRDQKAAGEELGIRWLVHVLMIGAVVGQFKSRAWRNDGLPLFRSASG
jgi:hypothetical protein